jgi:hypothetical protein
LSPSALEVIPRCVQALVRRGPLFGTLIQVSARGTWRVVADVSAYEAEANPVGVTSIDSSPHGVLAEPGARIVADAGGNSLVRIAANGNISTIAVFPSRPDDRPTDAVPTAVVRGLDGAYYVSELTGGPSFDEAANIYRVVPGLEPEVFLDGFRTVIDIDFDRDGSLYVLEHASAPVLDGPGRVILEPGQQASETGACSRAWLRVWARRACSCS